MTQNEERTGVQREKPGDIAILENALNDAGIYTFMYYPQEQRIEIPERTCRAYGCRSVYTDMPWSFAKDFVNPKYRPAFYKIYDAILAGKRMAKGLFCNMECTVYFQVTISVTEKDAGGRPLLAMGVIENLTDEFVKERLYKALLQKKNQELQRKLVLEQEEMNRRMDTILNGISGGFKISRNDEKFSYVYVSEALAQFLGYTLEEFLEVSNGNVMDFVYPDDVEETYRKEREDISKGDTYSCKYRVRCKDGTIKWIIDSGKLVRTGSGEEHFYSLYLDVDELERGRLELEEALAMLEQIVAANACGIFAYSLPDRRILQINREAIRLLGWEGEDIRSGMQVGSRMLVENLLPEDWERVGAMTRDIRKPGDSMKTFFRLQKDGEVRARVEIEVKRLRMPNGQDMILSTLVDVTEKSRMEEALNESLQAFHIASQEAGNIIVIYDIASQTVRFDRKDCCPFADGSLIRGVPYETVDNGTVAEESKEEYLRLHEAMIRGGDEADGIVKRITLDGREMITRLRFQRVTDRAGQPTGKAIGVYTDITQEYLHEAEQAVRMETIQSEYAASQESAKQELNRYMDVIRALSDDYFSIYQVDLTNNLIQTVRANDKLLPQVAATIGRQAPFDKTMEGYVRMFVHPEDQKRVIREINLSNIIQQLKKERTFIVRYRRVVGSKVEYTELKMVDVSEKRDGGRCVLAVRSVDREVRRDIEQQERLREALAQAQHSNNAKTIFLSNMSHDIRTPMNAIVGFSNIAAGHLDDKERVRDCVTKILTASNHLQNLINDILDMSRIESGKLILRDGVCDLPELVRSLMSVVQTQIRTRRLEFSTRVVGVRNEVVCADALKLRQVLINILGNAIKFTQPGGAVCMTIRQAPSPAEGCGRYTFTISDTGIGMSEEFQKHIFEPFERETTNTLGQTEGTGLGMSITKSIVDAMGGRILVDSERGVGSTFTVELDLRFQGPATAELPSLTGRRVLAVNGNPLYLSDVQKTLEGSGLAAFSAAASGKEALALERAAVSAGAGYDTCIIDRALPDMSGVELTGRLREQAADRPMSVILTDYDWSDIEREARAAGVTAFCAKPLFLSSLTDAILRAGQEPSSGEDALVQAGEKYVGTRILLVEDNELNREIAQELLTEQGFLVESAGDGAEALMMLKQSPAGYYQLILMDVQMPVMNGYDTTRAIRGMSREDLVRLPIIAMTANAFEEDKAAALKCGMNDHLAKPINMEQMMEKISRFLD